MKRTLVLLLAVAVLVLMVPIATASAEMERIENVPACHVNKANDTFVIINFLGSGNDVLVTFGKLISVSHKATAAHEGHGDRVYPDGAFQTFAEWGHAPDHFEQQWGISTPNADCWFGVVIGPTQP